MSRRVRGALMVALLVGLAGCTQSAPSGGAAASSGNTSDTPLEGTYRWTLTVDHLMTDGLVGKAQASADEGVQTAVIDDGEYSESWQNEVSGSRVCHGSYTAEGMTLKIVWTSAGCRGAWTMTGAIDSDTVTWSNVAPLDPNEKNDYIHYYDVPWTRID